MSRHFQPPAARLDRQAWKRQPLMHRIIKRVLFLGINLIYRIDFIDLDKAPQRGPLLLAANHTHLADVIAIHCGILPWIQWVGKKELFKLPILGRLFLALQAIPVNRDRADLSTARGILGALRQNGIVGMFPQGTRVKPDQVRHVRPRSGAAHFAIKADVPVLPVAVGGRFRPFGKVSITFGDAYRMEKTRDAQRIAALTLDLMRRIYDLIGQPYELEASPEASSGKEPS